MPKSARHASATNIYHVTARGVVKRRMFEDDGDRQRMLNSIARFKDKCGVSAIAWAFLENHLHLLASTSLAYLDSFMDSLLASYSQAFDGKHGNMGHVLQARYHSVPIESDSHLSEVVRYIYLNPQSSGISSLVKRR